MRLYFIYFEGLDCSSFAVCEPDKINSIILGMAKDEFREPEPPSEDNEYGYEGCDPFPIYVTGYTLDKEKQGWISSDGVGYIFQQCMSDCITQDLTFNSFEDF